MSLIYGIKTQEGVYLAADTRLTIKEPGGKISYEDDFAKYHTFGDYMHLVVAGDANLASYLINKIQSTSMTKHSYSQFRRSVSSFLREEAALYPHIESASDVVFIFSGHDPSEKDNMSMDKLIEFVQLMQGENEKPVPMRITKPLQTAFFQAASNKKEGDIIEIDKPLIGLFSIEININNGIHITENDAEWASYLMFGPKGLRADNAPLDLVIELDLRQKEYGTMNQDIIFENSTRLIKFFKKMIPEHQLETVGGAITTLFVSELGPIMPTGEILMVNKEDGSFVCSNSVIVHEGLISTTIGTEIVPLRHVVSYYKGNGSESKGARIGQQSIA